MMAEPSTPSTPSTNGHEPTANTGRGGRRWARRYLYPPSGREVRRLVAVMTLAVGLPRLPLVHELFPFAAHRFGDPAAFGVICTLAGLLLLVTAYDRRTGWARLAAVLGVVTWVTLAAATVSATSLLIDLAVAASLLMEAGTLREQ